jgi:hypothetical protein
MEGDMSKVITPAARVGYHRPETASIRDVYKVDARELCDPCRHLRNGVCLLGHERAREWSWGGRECPDWE